MKKILIFYFCVLATINCYGAEFQDEIFKIWKEIGEFEKKVPFFTKSKLTIFFSFEDKKLDGSFYGIYLNDNLIIANNLEIKTVVMGKAIYLGDFPVRTGKNIITLKFSKDNSEVIKKFEIDVPEFRRIAINLAFSGDISKIKINPIAWFIE